MEIGGPADRREAATVQRREVSFASGQDESAAWLYTAPDLNSPRPMVIMGHGLGAVREMRLDAYAQRFAAAGWSVLVFDYRHLGASGGTPRQILDIGRQRADWRAALAFVRTLPEVDVDRIALWGSSFGGGHVLRIASEDTRIAAVVAQCPFTDGPASLRSRLRTGPLSAVALTGAGIVDTIGSWFGAKPILLPMAGTSWMPAFVGLTRRPRRRFRAPACGDPALAAHQRAVDTAAVGAGSTVEEHRADGERRWGRSRDRCRPRQHMGCTARAGR